MMMWELALLPPMVRFFVALFLVLVVTGGAVLFTYWINKQG